MQNNRIEHDGDNAGSEFLLGSAAAHARRSATMKRYLLGLLFITFVITITAWAGNSFDFTGSWGTKGTRDVSFDLDLKQTGDKIEGYHTAVVLYTRSHHVDAVLPEDGTPSIIGTANGSKAKVQFCSSSEVKGTATITLQGNRIEWTIISGTSGHLLPKHAILYRQNEKQK